MSRVRRALHFVPGGSEKLLQKSLGLAADSLILDLEDAVPADRKPQARRSVTEWLLHAEFGGRERIVRINSLDTPWGRADLEETIRGRPDAYLIPKIQGPEDLQEIDRLLNVLEKAQGVGENRVRLIALASETPQGLLRIAEIARGPRLDALTWGPEDLSAALGARRNRDEAGQLLDVFRYAQSMTLLAAAAAGLQAIDTVWVDFRDSEGLRRSCQEASWMGFTGKLTIHPDQIPIVNEAFTPSEAEITESRELIDAFERAQDGGTGAFGFHGQMVDQPHLARARTILERARAAQRLG